MEMEVAVAVIIQNTPAITNGTMPSTSMSRGRTPFIKSVPKRNSAADKTHPIMGPMMVLVT